MKASTLIAIGCLAGLALGVAVACRSDAPAAPAGADGAAAVAAAEAPAPATAAPLRVPVAASPSADVDADADSSADGRAWEGGSPPLIPADVLEARAGAAREDTAVRTAVDRGLAWLARTQAANGSWIQDLGYKLMNDYTVTGKARPHVGVTALSCMAFLAGGQVPDRGNYGKVIENGTNFVLDCVDPKEGYISSEQSRMYSHAFATLFLAEVFGMTHRADLKQKLQLAVNLTVNSQNKHGSWRYEPNSSESDMSITVCQIMALRAARNIGIRVPKTTIDRASDYVKRSAYTSGPDRGGFSYQEKMGGVGNRTTFPLTAAGIATLHSAGDYDARFIRAGVDYLRSHWPNYDGGHYFFWYGQYYAAQVFWVAADDQQRLWDWYWPRIREELLRHQESNGSWKNSTGPGDAFSTAVACIVLQIPYQYLPIFQR